MSINLKGHILNQRQLDAITPVMNDYMHGKIKGHKKLEQACVAALEEAGCALAGTLPPGVRAVLLPPTMEISALDENAMRAAGWVRAERGDA